MDEEDLLSRKAGAMYEFLEAKFGKKKGKKGKGKKAAAKKGKKK